jgi:hypothetical protein
MNHDAEPARISLREAAALALATGEGADIRWRKYQDDEYARRLAWVESESPETSQDGSDLDP